MDFDLTQHENLLRDMAIPPRPQVVSVLFEEMSKDAPDLKRIAKQIAADVGLAAAMLKMANSPVFRRDRKVSTVTKAVDLLGLKSVSGIATGLAIRHAIGAGDKSQALERFWDSAEKTAFICGFLARHLRSIAADEAYTYGLFHNSGIPLLLRRFPAYREALIRANADQTATSFTHVEDVAVGANHAVIGYFMARSWGLADSMVEAILRHHDVAVFSADSGVAATTLNLVALGHLAEQIDHMNARTSVNIEWDRFGPAVLNHFGLSDEEFMEIAEDAAVAIETAETA
jgi:HD-like signal output (HDOD) protein